MTVQIVPIIKAVAPYLAQIASAAIPAFTSKPETARTDPVLSRQIEELQAAATENAKSIHLLAEKMQQTIQGLESAAQEARNQVATYKALLFLTLGISAGSLLTCIYLLFRYS
ncbi:MAG: hypothetical protein R2940_04555 [Syntrophotaleaceae bacterium]